MGQDLDPQLTEERPAEGSRGDPRRRLAGARTLEDVADVVEPVLHRADEVGVARARAGEAVRRIDLALGAHQLAVLLRPFHVRDRDRDRRAERAAVSDAGHDLEPVGLDLLAPAATVPLATSRELVSDVLRPERHPRRKTFEHRDEALTVRFTGGEEAEHAGHHRDRPAPAPRDAPAAGSARAAPARGRPRGRRPLPPWAGRRGSLLVRADAEREGSSPRTNVAQFPDVDRSRYRPLGPKVSPIATS